MQRGKFQASDEFESTCLFEVGGDNIMNDEIKNDITVESDGTSFEIRCIDIGLTRSNTIINHI